MKKFYTLCTSYLFAILVNAQTPSQNSVLINMGNPACNGGNAASISLMGSPLGTSTIFTNCSLSGILPDFYSHFVAYNPRDNNVYLADISSGTTKVWIINEGIPANISCPTISTTPNYTYVNGFVPNNFEFDANGDVWSVSSYNTGTGQCVLSKFDEATGTVLFTKTLQFPAGNFPSDVSNGDLTISPTGRMFATFGTGPSKLYEITNYTTGVSNATGVFLKNMPLECYGIAYLNGQLEIAGTNLSTSCYYYKYDIATNVLGAAVPFQNGQMPIDNSSLTASIGTSKRLVSQSKINSGTADLVYEVYARNLGNAGLPAFNISDDLGAIFGASNVSNVTTQFSSGGNPAGLILNNSYNGTTVTKLLNAGQVLPNPIPGMTNYSVTIQVKCRVINLNTSTIYYNSAVASATIGSGANQVNVADFSNDGGSSATDPNNDGNASSTGEDVSTPFNFALLLPVKFTHLEANVVNENTNKINWSIAIPAVKNGSFVIERSLNGFQWNTIGATTISNELQATYSFLDTAAQSDQLFYRIKETDPDNSYTYSAVILARKKNTNITITTFPNPANGVVNILYPHPNLNKTFTVTVTDLQGRGIVNQTIKGNLTKLDISKWPNGIYLFTISNQTEKNSCKITVVH